MLLAHQLAKHLTSHDGQCSRGMQLTEATQEENCLLQFDGDVIQRWTETYCCHLFKEYTTPGVTSSEQQKYEIQHASGMLHNKPNWTSPSYSNNFKADDGLTDSCKTWGSDNCRRLSRCRDNAFVGTSSMICRVQQPRYPAMREADLKRDDLKSHPQVTWELTNMKNSSVEHNTQINQWSNKIISFLISHNP